MAREVGRTREEAATLREEIEENESELELRSEQAQRLREELGISEVSVGLGDEVAGSEQQIRSAYMRALMQERAFLRDQRNAVQGHSSEFARIDGIWARINGVEERVYVEFA